MPNAMIILAVGMPRAGSGWHYNLVHDIVVAAGGQDARIIRRRYFLSPFLTQVNCNIRALSKRRLLPVLVPSRMGNTFAIKTHSEPTPIARRLISNGQMRVTYIYRDPRAALLSAIEYGQRSRESDRTNAFARLGTFEQAMDFILDYLRIWQQWMKVDGIHALRYEDLLTNYESEAGKLARFLDADPAAPAVKDAIEFYRSEKAAGLPGGKGQHFQHGQAERFRTALTAEELAKANKAFERYLGEMKYKI